MILNNNRMLHKKGMIETMKCRECGEEMYLDDKDFDFKGKYDNYWCCPKCQTFCTEQIRFSKPFKELWYSENNNNIKEYVVKCN